MKDGGGYGGGWEGGGGSDGECGSDDKCGESVGDMERADFLYMLLSGAAVSFRRCGSGFIIYISAVSIAHT